MDAQNSMSKYPAIEIRADLSLDEPSDGRALPSRPSQKGLDLLADDFVEKGLFGLMAFVWDSGDESAGTMKWGAAQPATANDGPRQLRREALGETDQPCAQIRRSSHSSNGSGAEPPGSHAKRDRTDSSLLAISSEWEFPSGQKGSASSPRSVPWRCFSGTGDPTRPEHSGNRDATSICIPIRLDF